MKCLKCGMKSDSGKCNNCGFDYSSESVTFVPFSYGHGVGRFYHSLALKKWKGIPWKIDSDYIKLDELSAAEGFLPAFMWLTRTYNLLEPKTDENRRLAKSWYGRAKDALISAADNGNVEAQSLLGSLFLNANGYWYDSSAHDYEEAKKWLFRASENGYKHDDSLIALMYRNGLGVEKDLEEAIRRYKILSDNDPSGLCDYHIGIIYCEEKKEYIEALKWLERSAEKGCPNACMKLSAMYRNGEGVDIDAKKSQYWLERNKVERRN